MQELIGWERRFTELIREATAPIYLRVGPRQLHPLGPGVFLALGNRRFLVTAAHVADAMDAAEPVIGSSSTVGSLKPRFITTVIPETGNRNDDSYDIAVAEVEPQWLVENPVTAVPARALDVDEGDYSDDVFVAAGYPFSKQDPRIKGTDLEAYLYRALALPYPAQVDPSTNRVIYLDLKFNRRRLFVEGRKRTGPSLEGMSGC